MDTLKKLKLYKLLSGLTAGVGLLLLIYMIFWEDEPGAVPSLLLKVMVPVAFLVNSASSPTTRSEKGRSVCSMAFIARIPVESSAAIARQAK